MRRILRKIAEGEADKLGDTSTLADPSIVEVTDTHRGRQTYREIHTCSILEPTFRWARGPLAVH